IGVIIGALAILFNFLIIKSQKIMDKCVKQFPYWARLLFAFVLTGVLGLIFTKFFEDGFAFLNTGGHSLIDLLCHGGVFKYSILMLIGVIILRMILLLVCFNSGATGGLFIPMLAIGALLGAIIGTLFVEMGMDSMYFPAVIVISMTTFFGASVRAPITAIVLVVELSGYKSDFLPIAISIFTAYLVAEILGNSPIYDAMLDRLVEQNSKNVVKKEFVISVGKGTFAVGRQVQDIMWPAGAHVTHIVRTNGDVVMPNGKTELKVGDELTVKVESSDFRDMDEFIATFAEKKSRNRANNSNGGNSNNKSRQKKKAVGKNVVASKEEQKAVDNADSVSQEEHKSADETREDKQGSADGEDQE
ncbi:MAG: chloride channel protein, partial [Clostridia bacterium]|nr:chloride channel protein [Clostridia bacterium]